VPQDEPPPIFFVHIMKTAGTTMNRLALRNLETDQIFPPPPDEPNPVVQIFQYVAVRPFVELDPTTRSRMRWLSGHVPLSVAETTCPDATPLVLLRDPVERTLSYLRHCQVRQPEHQGRPLEEIYEDEWWFPRFIQDHQTKMLSMTFAEATTAQLTGPPRSMVEQAEHDPELRDAFARDLAEAGTSRALLELSDRAPTELVDVDDARLAAALEALDRIDLLEVTPNLPRLLTRLSARYGWDTPNEWHNRTADQPVPASFRARIAADNAADVELYARAEVVCDRRALG
jgi:hypothetical protein